MNEDGDEQLFSSYFSALLSRPIDKTFPIIIKGAVSQLTFAQSMSIGCYVR